MLLRHDFIYSVWVDISKGFSRISKIRVRFGTIENPFYVYKEHSYTLRDMDFNLLGSIFSVWPTSSNYKSIRARDLESEGLRFDSSWVLAVFSLALYS